jgi:aerobic carbon-monoxide dehydrogenase large subunit
MNLFPLTNERLAKDLESGWNRPSPMKSGNEDNVNTMYGQAITRREDSRLISGRGRYVDDVSCPGVLRAFFVRSPYPAAAILSINTGAALALPGVVAVLTAADITADGYKDWAIPAKLPKVGGGFSIETPKPLLVRDKVRFLGEPVAIVLAETEAAAQDAAELVAVEYSEETAVQDPFSAAAPNAQQLWNDRPGNLAYHWQAGDADGVAKALAVSHHVARLRSHVSRVCHMPMEPRSALAFIGEDGRPVLQIAHQAPHQMRNYLADCFGLNRKALRVIAEDVGGSFGLKSGFAREETLVFWAARHLKCPVRWTAHRSESFLSDDQGRDVFITSELGLDSSGKFTALRVRYDVNIGAYMDNRTTFTILNFGGIAGVYSTPLIVGEAFGYFTNTQPTLPYRGAGRPEATFAIERIIDVAASEMGIDPAELRRRNLISPNAMPYQTPFLFKYDCGEFERAMDRALELAGYRKFAERRKEAKKRGLLCGIGISNPIEVAAGPYAKPGTDWAGIRAHPDGTVTLFTGQKSVGQGLDTALSTVVAQRLELPLSKVKYVDGDTDLLENGKGNGGSSALALAGSAAIKSVEDLLEKATKVASDELEASPLDIEYSAGEFRIVGSDRTISLADVASTAEKMSDGDGAGLHGAAQLALDQPTFPNGCHICEVEIDPETGQVDVINYVSVEDVGRVMNPLLVEGQIHGGVVQGVGQAVLEEVRYDGGQLITGSFMDYAMPRADDVPNIVSENLEIPTAINPLGAKGVGEAGAVGGMAAAMNAICHALEPAGIRHLDMPATPSRIWKALRDAGYKHVSN